MKALTTDILKFCSYSVCLEILSEIRKKKDKYIEKIRIVKESFKLTYF